MDAPYCNGIKKPTVASTAIPGSTARTCSTWHLTQSSRDPVIAWPTWADVEEAQRIVEHLAQTIFGAKPEMPAAVWTVESKVES